MGLIINPFIEFPVTIDGDFDTYTNDRGQKNETVASQNGAWEFTFTSTTVIQIHWAVRGGQDVSYSDYISCETWNGSTWTVRDQTPALPTIANINTDSEYQAYDRTIDGFTATNCTKIRFLPKADVGGNSDLGCNAVCVTYQES